MNAHVAIGTVPLLMYRHKYSPNYPCRLHQHDVYLADITALYNAVQEQKSLTSSDGSTPFPNVTFDNTTIPPLQLESNTDSLIDASLLPILSLTDQVPHPIL